MDNLRSLLGIAVIVGIGVLFSTNRRAIRWRLVLTGLVLQLAFGLFVLKTPWGVALFRALGDGVNKLIGFSTRGAEFVFGKLADPGSSLGFIFTFQVMPSVILMGALMAVLYHMGVMQRVVQGMAWVMRRVMGVSGAESLAAAANVFVGQTEAPLIVRPYLERMTRSELMALMSGGFATIAGGVLVAYSAMGIDPAHLLAASVMSAPAALVMAKLLVPETETPVTATAAAADIERTSANVVDAAAAGTSDGLKLALNVVAMLIAFIALMHLADACLAFIGEKTLLVGLIQRVDPGFERLTLGSLFGLIFRPVAFAIGVPWEDAARYGELIGTQITLTELVAYLKLAEWLPTALDADGFSPRAAMIATYGLCAFANVGSIGIQLGGIGAVAESRRQDLARLAVRAMFAGLLAANLTASIAGALVSDAEAEFRHARVVAERRLHALEVDEAGAMLEEVARRRRGSHWGQRARTVADRVAELQAAYAEGTVTAEELRGVDLD